MPSNTLKDYDKFAWGWVENTDPKLITHDHIFAAYRIKTNFCVAKACRRNCRGNPFCLSGLGEIRLVESLNKRTDVSSTTLPKRADGDFVGLKNLGATCYVNSLLQLWFHNKVFRNAIFSWNPMEDPVEQKNSSLYTNEVFIPQSVVGHLQQLFALMYYSKCRYIDPSSFVESLRLDTSTQQDAQEFSKLFISLLESTLSHQSLQHVKNLISNNFRGEYAYITRCCNCLTESVSPSMFYELDLSVENHHTLNECLSEFLQEEKLQGADCYSCEVCQTKQEASRFIKICSLPPVLNLQLLRFVYDREKGQKKKLKTVVQFPEILDMKEFVQTNTEDSLLYNLSAVLIHKGARASSGHFIAYIKDELTGAWNTFNDECVQKLKGKLLKLDEEDPENLKKHRIPKLPKGCQSSTDAYMLVYISEKHHPSLIEGQLSSRLQQYVDSQNKIFDEFCEEIYVSKKQGLVRQEKILALYNSLSVGSSDDLNDIEVLPVDWLTSWLDSKTDISQEIDNTKLLCTHGRLDPCALNRAKYISVTTADLLYNQYGGGPRLKMSDAVCETCVTNYCHIYRTKAKTQEESKEIVNLLKKRMGVDEPGYYVDKYCLKTWRTKVLKLIEGKTCSSSKTTNGLHLCGNEDNSEALTEESVPASQTIPTSCSEPDSIVNGNKKAENTKLLYRRNVRKSKFMNVLQRRKQNSTVTVPLNVVRDCFVLCQKLQVTIRKQSDLNEFNEHSLLNQCKQLKVKLKKLTSPSKSVNSLRQTSSEKKKEKVSCDVIKDHDLCEKVNLENDGINTVSNGRTAVKQEEGEGNKSDEGVDSDKGFNEAIMCPHGNLSIEESERKLVPVRVWEILKQYFPYAPSFSHDTEPCLQCQKLASKDEVVKQLYQESAINQKKSLSDLFYLRNRPVLGKTEDIIYLLSREHFHHPWSAFLKSLTRRDGGVLMEPPSSLKVDSLFCMHGLLHYSPTCDEDQTRLVPVTQEEWETLLELYPTDYMVTVNPDLSTSPEVCHSCLVMRLENEHKERLNYERTRLVIRQVPSATTPLSEDQELADSGTAKKKMRLDNEPLSPVPPELKKVGKGPPHVDVRRSARNRKIPGQKDVHVTVSSNLTLRELKQMITNQLAVAPFDQHLSAADGRELLGDYNTLSTLGILPNSTLLLQIDEPKESLDDMFEESNQLTEPEAGFKGTGLLLHAD